MTTPEQRLFSAQQVYPDSKWKKKGDNEYYTISAPNWMSKSDVYFIPENNAEQWRDVFLFIINNPGFNGFDAYNGFEIWDRITKSYVSIGDKIDTEALILAVCALGGFDEKK